MTVISEFRKVLIELDTSHPCRKGKEHAWQPTGLTLLTFATGEFSTRPGFQCVYCRYAFATSSESEDLTTFDTTTTEPKTAESTA